MNKTKQLNTKLLVRLSLLSAIGVLLFYVVAFRIPPFPEHLTYDAGDIPGLIATCAFGPLFGVLVQFLKAFLGFLVGGSKAGWVGAFANFIAGGTMAFTAGIIYSRKKTKARAMLSLFIGSLVTAIVMGPANYFVLLPLWGVPQNTITVAMIVPSILFTFVKFMLSSLVTFLLYKKVKNFLEEDYFTNKIKEKRIKAGTKKEKEPGLLGNTE